jgi:hypothetical protein
VGLGYRTRGERVAQSVEHVTFNHGVVGSSPTALTNILNNIRRFVHRIYCEHATPTFMQRYATSLRSAPKPKAPPTPYAPIRNCRNH